MTKRERAYEALLKKLSEAPVPYDSLSDEEWDLLRWGPEKKQLQEPAR